MNEETPPPKILHFDRQCLSKSTTSHFKMKASYLEDNTIYVFHYKNGSFWWRFNKSDIEKYMIFEQSVDETSCNIKRLELYVFIPPLLFQPYISKKNPPFTRSEVTIKLNSFY